MNPIETADQFLGKDQETQDELLRKQLERAKFLYTRTLHSIVTSSGITRLCERIKAQTGVALNHDQLQLMLMELFPDARVELSCNGYENPEAFQTLLDSVACFLVGTTYQDCKEFHEVMVKQSEALGLQKGKHHVSTEQATRIGQTDSAASGSPEG